MLKQSQYNRFFEYNGVKYAYNLLTTSLIQLDDSCDIALERHDIESLPDEAKELLIEEGFLVDINCNEVEEFRYYYDHARFCSTSDVLAVTFIPTYNCNLRCPYCYEGQSKSEKKIAMEEIDSVLLFIENRINECREDIPIRVLDIQLYGGEPLLCKKELVYFCDRVSHIAEKEGIKTQFSMVSNLTLLDDDIINLIRQNDIYVQVSIDGNKTEHDKRRIWANGKGSFDQIINNLERLLAAGLKKNVIIRLNSDLGSIQELCSQFRSLTKYSSDIYFGILTSYKGCNDGFENCIDSAVAEKLLSEKADPIYKELGLPIPQRFGKKGPCSLNSENKYMIDCNLDVYKCDLLINHRECRIGYITKDGKLHIEGNFYKQMGHSPFNSQKCVQCNLLPQCAGGCPALVYLNSGKRDGTIDYYDCSFSNEKLDTVLKSFVQNQ